MKEFFLIMPELVLALTLAFVIASEITYYGEQVRLVIATSLLGLGGAFIQAVFSYRYGPTQILGGTLSIDGFSLFFKLFFIGLASLSILTVILTEEITKDRITECCSLILASALAMCLVASASNLIFIFVSLLFLNVVGYFLAAYGKRSVLSTEAAVKYLAFGSVSTMLFLYAVALLFAWTHSLNIYEIHRFLMQNPLPTSSMLIVFMLSFLGICFQLGAFPMYLVVPDIIEGAPTPISAFLSLGSRAAGFALATRFLVVVFAQPGDSAGHWKILGDFDWTQIIATISALTMAIGSLLAYRQVAAKRLVGYLVVFQSGFLLIGLLVLDEVGVAGLLYHFVIELFALMGSFFILSFIRDKIGSDRIEDLKGMLRKAVPECICLIMFLFCLTGIPPMPGFIGKFTLLGVAIRHQRFALATVGVISMVISTAAVAKLAYYLIGDFQKSRGSVPLATSLSRNFFLGALMIPMVLVGIFADFVFKWAGHSLGFIFW